MGAFGSQKNLPSQMWRLPRVIRTDFSKYRRRRMLIREYNEDADLETPSAFDIHFSNSTSFSLAYPLEHFPARLNHLTGMILCRGQARFRMAMGAPSAKQRNAATTQKHPAFGGADRINLAGKCSRRGRARRLFRTGPIVPTN